MKTRNPETTGRLYYAINPYEDEWDRHIALNVIYAVCDKTGGFGMRGQAPLPRARMKAPPPSLAGHLRRLQIPRRKINAVGHNQLVYASFHREKVEARLMQWRRHRALNPA